MTVDKRRTARSGGRRRNAPVVVGVGASAGGLEALQRMFEHVPEGAGLCFVVVQHLAPDHKSMMVELLAKHTRLTVREIEEGAPVVADHVYVLPPGKTVSIQQDRLHLSVKTAAGGRALPIDLFLATLAKDRGPRSAAVILSGTGSDGTRGVAAIRQAGGLVVVQDPATAKFDGMPRSVILAGLSDSAVPAEEIGQALVGAFATAPGEDEIAQAMPPEAFAAVVDALKRETGVDFADYKEGTIHRRIERRMQMNGIDSLDEYVTLLQRSPSEVGQLYKDLLIGVTKFFRDADAFAVLRQKVVPAIVSRAADRDTIRVWVCGCSTGEEAYSLAILFAEEVARSRKAVEVKVFATDLDRDAIETASLGVYEAEAVSEVPAELRERYFNRRGDQYVVARSLRQNIVFARHNILKDPPFTKLELVSCRNLLIYMEPVLQRRVLALFNYALNREGFLFLGSSETLGDLAGEFTPVDVKHKIFRADGTGIHVPDNVLSPLPPLSGPRTRRRAPQGDEDVAIDQGLALLIEAFAPPAILMTERGELLHVFGDASRYLRVPTGHATLDVIRLLPSALATVVTSALHKAIRDGQEIEYAAVPFNGPAGIELVTLKVRPFTQQTGRRYALLVLVPQQLSQPTEGLALDPNELASDRIRSLENDLATSQQSLQATVEELETSNEELQAANEELLASNEELQSTNEELQSVNEELYTLNSEYEAKIDELTRLTDDMDNLLRATEVGTVFLDRNLTVRRFTPAASCYVNLIARDLGRSIAHISTNLDYPAFLADIEAVQRSGVPLVHEVRWGDTHVLVRMQPYTADHGGENERRAGVVVTFVDVTAVKQAERRLQAVIESLPEQVAVLDRNGTVVFVNRAWAEASLPGTLAGAPLGQNYLDFCRRGAGCDRTTSARALDGVQELLAGRSSTVMVDYAIEDEAHRHLGILNASLLDGIGIVLSHVLIPKDLTLGQASGDAGAKDAAC